MTSTTAADRPPATLNPAFFAFTTFASACLVFMVQPMVAKLVLPLLGGSPSVWNTSVAFFQTALLAGYGYAHLLQRLKTVRGQAIVHVTALVAAAVVLPLRVNALFGPPSSEHPSLWLLGVLAVSIGAPFAILSATAPLVQAWHARVVRGEGEPYALYAASNLGSLLALLAYPIVVEPLTRLHSQTLGWSVAYGAFVLLMAGLAMLVTRAPDVREAVAETDTGARSVTWSDRLVWVFLAAIPSSLMLGVTTHLATDVASAPFLWVVPLALYLVTFIIAFQTRPAIPRELTLTLQAAALAAVVVILPFKTEAFGVQIFVHLAAFFLTALMCHQALVARRPDPAHLTEFYLWMSFGGVVGGAFNAFAAPVIFNNVYEYPLVLALSCLARPWDNHLKIEPWRWVTLAVGIATAVAGAVLMSLIYSSLSPKLGLATPSNTELAKGLVKALLTGATICVFLIRRRALMFFVLVVVLSVASGEVGNQSDTLRTWRSFFGVVKQSQMDVPPLGGKVTMLSHGTTLHGAQAQAPKYRCRPLVYYAPETPIGQVFTKVMSERAGLQIGAVGLGTGAVSAYTRPGDVLTFFEIDPLVIDISTNPDYFSYTTECAKGRIDYVLGDARLTLASQPNDKFDILLIDAFSSDAVPAHLLTVEAVKGYLAHLKPDGVLILHLSNRNLELRSPAMSVAAAAGGKALLQRHSRAANAPVLWESAEDAVIVGRSDAALARFAGDERWEPSDPTKATPWTDDYTNLVSALYRRIRENLTWLP